MFDFAAARRMMVDCQVRTSDVTDRESSPRCWTCRASASCRSAMPRWPISTSTLPVTDGRRGAAAAQADGAGEAHPGGRDRSAGCACSMSPAAPAIRRRCWPGWRAPSWRWRRTRHWPRTRARTSRPLGVRQCRSGDAAHCPTAGRRGAPYDVILLNGAAEVVPDRLAAPVARRADGWSGWSGARRRSKAVLYLATGGQASALPIFDAAAPPLPGFAEPAGLRILIPRRPSFPQPKCGAESASSRVFHAFAPAEFPQGFHRRREAAYG